MLPDSREEMMPRTWMVRDLGVGLRITSRRDSDLFLKLIRLVRATNCRFLGGTAGDEDEVQQKAEAKSHQENDTEAAQSGCGRT
jgi:hypothetical protein